MRIVGFIITLFLMGLFAFLAYSRYFSPPTTISPLDTSLLSAENQAQIDGTLTPVKVTVNPSKTPHQPLVVYEAESSFSTDDKAQITQKVIDPFITYYQEAGQGNLETLTISLNTQTNQDAYPFLAEANFDNDVKLGFVVSRDQDSLDWWFPECLGVCVISAEFADKFPEIAAQINSI